MTFSEKEKQEEEASKEKKRLEKEKKEEEASKEKKRLEMEKKEEEATKEKKRLEKEKKEEEAWKVFEASKAVKKAAEEKADREKYETDFRKVEKDPTAYEIEITGAGNPKANNVWKYDEIFNKKPSYGPGYRYQVYWYNSGSYWSTEDSDGKGSYKNTSDTAIPPSSGWEPWHTDG